mgnify:CR=1 FL=1
MSALRPDLCVIGAGSGGLTVAAGAAQMGASVVLIEAGEMGGDCLNFGCVPSKALIAAGKAAHAMGAGAAFGVRPAAAEVDFAAAKDHVRAVIDGIAPHDSQERFEGLGVTVIRARGRFVSPEEVEAGGARIRARRFVIATGSRPAAPPVPGLAETGFLTNETIFDLRERPRRLLVLGGGPIGLELAQAHRRLGCEVEVVEAATALGREDAEAAAVVLAALRVEGVSIREGAAVEAARREGAETVLTLSGGAELRGDALLVAAGRRANVEDLGLDAAGIETTKSSVKVDRGLRTTNRRVYAIGDAAGGAQFTHLAGWQGGLAIRSALFRLPVDATRTAIPRATFTDPELAQVGLTEAEARAAHGDRLEVCRADYAGNDRARAERRTEGFCKVMVAKGRPVGATIVGDRAGDLISIWSLAMSKGLKIGDVAGFVAPYPTFGELPKRAASAYFTPRLFGSKLVSRAVRLLAKLP